jgi:hypothetical protein
MPRLPRTAPRRPAFAVASRHAVSAVTLLLVAAPVAAWGPSTQVAVASTAAKLAPPDLAREIELRSVRFREGVLAPFQEPQPERHYRNVDRGILDRTLADEVSAAIATLRKPAPFDELVYRLGRVAHFVTDANNPLNAAGDDPAEARYFSDWLSYGESARPRFAAVYYTGEPAIGTDRDLRQLVFRALARGRGFYPRVGDEYRRIGYGSGRRAFDDRSTAFGVAAVSYSHAISDVARVLRYIWIQGGGRDSLPQPATTTASTTSFGVSSRLLLLAPQGAGP